MGNLMKNSILIIFAICLYQVAGKAQDFRSNAIVATSDFGKNKTAFHIAYQRKVSKHLGVVASFGERAYNAEFNNLKSGEITGRVVDFGMGGQFTQNANGSGFFLEGGVSLSSANWVANGKSPLPDNGNRYSSIGGVVLNFLFNGSNYEVMQGKSEKQQLSPYGKFGYRFIGEKGILSFAPFVMFQGVVGENKITLVNNSGTKAISIDPTKDITPMSFGLETSIRF